MFDLNVAGSTWLGIRTYESEGIFSIESGSILQVGETTFTYNYTNKVGVFDVDDATLQVNDTKFYRNSARVEHLSLHVAGSSNVSFDFDVSLYIT